MARVSADTLKTRSTHTPAEDPPRRGRRPTNGNPAQAPRQARQPELPVAGDEEGEVTEPEQEEQPTPAVPAEEPPADQDADTDEVPAPPPVAKQTRGRRSAPTLDEEQQDLIALGRLTRFALENGLTVDDCAERFRAMLDAYDRHIVVR